MRFIHVFLFLFLYRCIQECNIIYNDAYLNAHGVERLQSSPHLMPAFSSIYRDDVHSSRRRIRPICVCKSEISLKPELSHFHKFNGKKVDRCVPFLIKFRTPTVGDKLGYGVAESRKVKISNIR